MRCSKHTKILRRFFYYGLPVLTVAGFLWNGTRQPRYQSPPVLFPQPNATKHVLLFAYMRSGSTFTGGIFDNEPAAFYMFEPLDGAYSAIYGTENGWNVPADITLYRNGSGRTRPEYEVIAVRNTLRKVFSCEFYSLPIEVTVSKFFWYGSLHYKKNSLYINCLNHLYKKKPPECSDALRPFCERRMNTDLRKQEECRQSISDIRAGHGVKQSKYARDKAFVKYESCIKELYNHTYHCTKILHHLCRRADVRVIKSIRTQMTDADWLLSTDPDLYVVHLIRDPRGVVNSRIKHKWAKSLASLNSKRKDMILKVEASVYCSDLMRDIRLRRKLEKRYPGRIMEMIYDWNIENHNQGFSDIYNLIGIPLSNYTKQYLKQSNAYVASQWQRTLTVNDMKIIDNKCRLLYDLVPKYWMRMKETSSSSGQISIHYGFCIFLIRIILFKYIALYLSLLYNIGHRLDSVFLLL